MIPYHVSVNDWHAEMYPLVGCMQILFWVKEVVTLKGFKLSGVPCTHCLVGTMFYKVLNLNAFQREKHSPVGHGFHHNP